MAQYVEGFKNFFHYYKNYFNSYQNVFIVDNTLKDISFLDERIVNEIPKEAQYVFTQKNNYGKINKGAGLLENWHALKETIFEYEFMFHYEPRLLIKTPEIFNRFTKERKTTFLEHEIEQFKTGALIIKTSNFKTLKNNDIKIKQKIIINQKRYKKIILGKKGEMIKKIREDSQKKMSHILKAKIHLYLEILNA